jgi:hypothetical protein
MKDIYDEITFLGPPPGDIDDESGIRAQHFELRYGYIYNAEVIFIRAAILPDYEKVLPDYERVVDFSPESFPDAEFALSLEDFKHLIKMFLRFDERL